MNLSSLKFVLLSLFLLPAMVAATGEGPSDKDMASPKQEQASWLKALGKCKISWLPTRGYLDKDLDTMVARPIAWKYLFCQ